MCGIAGFTHSKGPDPERIWEITRSLIHRGPDQQGVWESANVSLGAVRLKIIDLDHGDQPIASDDGDTVLVFNGEIYNHAELRRELEARAIGFTPAATPRWCCTRFSNGTSTRSADSAGCLPRRFWTQSTAAAGSGARSHGDQAAVLRQRGRELLLRLGAEGDFAASRNRPASRSGGAGAIIFRCNYVPGPERWWRASRSFRRGTGWNGGTAQCRIGALIGGWSSSPTQAEIGTAKEELDGLLAIRRSASIWYPMFRWVSGRAAAWILPPSCTTRQKRRRRV